MIMALRLAAHPPIESDVVVSGVVTMVVWAGGPCPSRQALLAQVQ